MTTETPQKDFSDLDQFVLPIDNRPEHLATTVRGELLTFALWGKDKDKTVYNPSVPFVDRGEKVMLGRLEGEDVENDSQVVLFDLNSRHIIADAPRFEFSQDPYYLGQLPDSNGELWHVVGMVKLELDEEGDITGWHDEFYKYRKSVTELRLPDGTTEEPFARGAEKQKDTRMVSTPAGILGMPRPQGEFGGQGSIGAFITPNIDTFERDLHKYFKNADPDTLIKPAIEEEGKWRGSNQLLLREDGRTVDVYSHQAEWREGEDGLKRDYEATHFTYDLYTGETSTATVIATAKDFPHVEPKFDSLRNVVFTSGTTPSETPGKRWLYVGVGDRAVGRILIDDPTHHTPETPQLIGRQSLKHATMNS